MQGLTDRSRRPYRTPTNFLSQVENYVLNVKRSTQLGCSKNSRTPDRRFSGIPIPAKAPFMRCSIVTAWLSAGGRVRHRATKELR